MPFDANPIMRTTADNMKHNNPKYTHYDIASQPVPTNSSDIKDGCSGLYPANKIPPGFDSVDELEESLKNCTRYSISRHAVESCDVTQLIHDLRPTLDNPLFAGGPGKVIFKVEGYDISPRHLPLVTDFRKFIRKAAGSIPCWFYFAWPLSEWPELITLACATHLTIRDVDHKNVQFGIDGDELGEFLRNQIGEMETLCTAMDIPMEAVINHLERIFVRWFPDYRVEECGD